MMDEWGRIICVGCNGDIDASYFDVPDVCRWCIANELKEMT